MRVQQLLAARMKDLLSPEGRRSLKYYLGPLLCHNPGEQDRFYKAYDRYLKEVEARSPTGSKETHESTTIPTDLAGGPTPPPEVDWTWARLIPLIPLLLVIGSLFFRDVKPEEVNALIRPASPPTMGQEAEFVVDGLDTNRYEFDWQVLYYDSSEVYRDTLENQLLFRADSIDRIRLIVLEESTLAPMDTTERDVVVLCADPPVVRSIQTDINPVLDSTIRFSGEMESDLDGLTYSWQMGDGTTYVTPNPTHRYTQPGVYTVRLQVFDPKAEGDVCESAVKSLTLNLQRERPLLAEKQLELDDRPGLAMLGWGSYALWLIAPFLLVYVLLHILQTRHSQKRKKEEEQYQLGMAEHFKWVDKAPYSIPFRSREELIQVAPEQYDISRLLRRKQEGTQMVLDVPATIGATVQQGGFPTVEYAYLTRPTDYLFLIDLASADGYPARLFQHLVSIFQEQEVHLELYYYENTFERVWNGHFPQGISLDVLHRMYPDRRLIVFGDGYGLMKDQADGRLQPDQQTVFRRWNQRLLITSLPVVSWTWKEARLYQLFPLFPADLSGLVRAAQFVESGMTEEDLPLTLARWEDKLVQSAFNVDVDRRWRKYADHSDYLKDHPSVLRWLTALSVYPQPEWNVTIAIGKALGVAVNLNTLLLLARIPWLQEGRFPPRLWKEFQHQLDEEDERLAREAVRDELVLVEEEAAGSYADRKRKKELAIQVFALEPGNRENWKVIRYLQDSNQLDRLRREELDRIVEREPDIRKEQWQEYLAGKTKEVRLDHWSRVLGFGALAVLIIGLFFRFTPPGQAAVEDLKNQDTPFGTEGPLPDAVYSNNEGVRVYYDTLYSAAGFDGPQLSSFYGLDTQSTEAFEWFMQARQQDLDYFLPSMNMGRVIYNEALRAYTRMDEDSTYVDRAISYLDELTEFDTLRLDALHLKGLVHYYSGQVDSACVALETLLESDPAYFSNRPMPNLRTLTNCIDLNEVEVLLVYDNEREQEFALGLLPRLDSLGYKQVRLAPSISRVSGPGVQYFNRRYASLALELAALARGGVPTGQEPELSLRNRYGSSNGINIELDISIAGRESGPLEPALKTDDLTEVLAEMGLLGMPFGLRPGRVSGFSVRDSSGVPLILYDRNFDEEKIGEDSAGLFFLYEFGRYLYRNRLARNANGPDIERYALRWSGFWLEALASAGGDVFQKTPLSYSLSNSDATAAFQSGVQLVNETDDGDGPKLMEDLFPNPEVQVTPSEVQRILEKIIRFSGFPDIDIRLEEDDSQNVYSDVRQGQAYITYDPRFFQRLSSEYSPWFMPLALAHEMAHIVYGHAGQMNQRTTPQTELIADRFAGLILGRLNASWEDVRLAMASIAQEEASATHPSGQARMNALGEGFEGGGGKVTTEDQTIERPIGNREAGRQLFLTNCAACHDRSMQRALVGPALSEVEERWSDYPITDLYQWIRSSQRLIESRHPRAMDLWTQYRPTQMPAFPQFSDQDIENILAFIREPDDVNDIPAAPASDLPGMVFVEGGTFTMGCTPEQGEDCKEDEKPTHQVTLSDFYMGRFEVTVGEFADFINATGYRTDADKEGWSYLWNAEKEEFEQGTGVNWKFGATGEERPASEYDHPVIHVSWNDAVAYCNWRSEQEGLDPVYTIREGKGDPDVTANWEANGYRLPTEAEWEFAARSRVNRDKWAGTSDSEALAGYANIDGKEDGFEYTAPVGSLRPNALGLYDMSGNVWEWCWGRYSNYPDELK